MNVAKVEMGLSLLVFVASIVGIVILTFRYFRDPSLTVYGFTGGSGQLWLIVVAIISLEVFLIAFEEQKKGGYK